MAFKSLETYGFADWPLSLISSRFGVLVFRLLMFRFLSIFENKFFFEWYTVDDAIWP